MCLSQRLLRGGCLLPQQRRPSCRACFARRAAVDQVSRILLPPWRPLSTPITSRRVCIVLLRLWDAGRCRCRAGWAAAGWGALRTCAIEAATAPLCAETCAGRQGIAAQAPPRQQQEASARCELPHTRRERLGAWVHALPPVRSLAHLRAAARLGGDAIDQVRVAAALSVVEQASHPLTAAATQALTSQPRAASTPAADIPEAQANSLPPNVCAQ